MPNEHRLAALGGGPRPWTLAGGLDPDFDDVTRNVHQALLTDTSLLTCFRRRFPERRAVDYDEMVRSLGYVWDCPHDGCANVTGYRCAQCGRTRAAAAPQPKRAEGAARPGRAHPGGGDRSATRGGAVARRRWRPHAPSATRWRRSAGVSGRS